VSLHRDYVRSPRCRRHAIASPGNIFKGEDSAPMS
jgi:hypothetical protein